MIHGTLESAMGRKQFLRDIILALSKVTMPGGVGDTWEHSFNGNIPMHFTTTESL